MKVIEISENEFNEKIKNGHILIDCYATWCGPCRLLSPIIDELSEELKEISFYKIDIDNAPNIVSKYDIMSIPTLLIFENGKLKKELVGLQEKNTLIKELTK